MCCLHIQVRKDKRWDGVRLYRNGGGIWANGTNWFANQNWGMGKGERALSGPFSGPVAEERITQLDRCALSLKRALFHSFRMWMIAPHDSLKETLSSPLMLLGWVSFYMASLMIWFLHLDFWLWCKGAMSCSWMWWPMFILCSAMADFYIWSDIHATGALSPGSKFLWNLGNHLEYFMASEHWTFTTLETSNLIEVHVFCHIL
jgi:hypothetical protein